LACLCTLHHVLTKQMNDEARNLDKKEAHRKTESQPQNFRPRQTS
jgi:hypothetical protein